MEEENVTVVPTGEVIKYLNLDGLTEFKRLLDLKLENDKGNIVNVLNDIASSIGEGNLTIKRNNVLLPTKEYAPTEENPDGSKSYYFSANDFENKEINIDVPDDLSDLQSVLGNGHSVTEDIINIIKYGQIDVSDLTEGLKESLEESLANLFNYVQKLVLEETLKSYGTKINYDPNRKKILLINLSKNSQGNNEETVISDFSADDFILDGMLSDVRTENYNYADDGEADDIKYSLIFTVNLGPGMDDNKEIAIPVSQIFDSALYYTSDEIDDKLSDIEAMPGPAGLDGADGKSAYLIALDNGFSGTEIEWLNSLKGQNGQNGTDGVTPHIDSTSKHWMIGETDTGILAEGLNGQDGLNGSDGITPHIDQTTGNWMLGDSDTGIKAQGPAGTDGSNGSNGLDGKSAYQLAVENGYLGTLELWLTSLLGQDGSNGSDGITPHIDQTTGNWFIGDTNTGVQAQGSTGKSAYQSYLDTTSDNPVLSETDWSSSKEILSITYGTEESLDYSTLVDSLFRNIL